MPKVTVSTEFNLPEEDSEFNQAIQQTKMANVLREVAAELRKQVKYGEGKMGVIEFREIFYKIIAENALDLDL